MEVNIRYATEKDLIPLTDIYNSAIEKHTCTGDLDTFSYDSRKIWLKEHMTDKYCCLVAEKNNRVIGYGTLSPYRKDRNAFLHVAEISIYIMDGFSGQGIGSLILKGLEDAAHERGITILMSYLFESNNASIALLSGNGFSKWGELPNAVRQTDFVTDHLIYGKELKKNSF